MSKCTDIRDICGDYAFDVEYSENNKFTMFFNSYRNAKTVKRIIEVDDSIPNVATAVDFVEVVRCKECKHWEEEGIDYLTQRPFGSCKCPYWEHPTGYFSMLDNDYCSYGERRDDGT